MKPNRRVWLRMGVFGVVLCAGVSVPAAPPALGADTNVVVMDLGLPAGAAGGTATGINERGEVVGSAGYPSIGGRAFFWSKKSGFVDLGDLGQFRTEANGINAAGAVAGSAFVDGQPHAAVWDRRDGWLDVAGEESHAWALNDAGTVVGNLGNPAFVAGNPQPFMWTKQAGLTVLDLAPGFVGANARGINNAGDIVGEAKVPISVAPFFHIHAFLWTRRDGMRDLGQVALGPSPTGPFAINNSGEAVGILRNGSVLRGFIWTESGGIVELNPAGSTSSLALAINHHGDVVGAFDLFNPNGMTMGQPFVWSETAGFIELPTLAGGLGLARGINNAGVIAGQSIASDGQSHPVVWTVRGR